MTRSAKTKKCKVHLNCLEVIWWNRFLLLNIPKSGGWGGQLSPCPHQSSTGHGCWLPSTPTSTWWRCLLMTSNCAFAGAAKSSQKLADLLIIFLLSFKTQRFQDLEKLLFARPFGWPIFWLLPRPSIILSKNSCTTVRRFDLLQIFQPTMTEILTAL